MLRAIAADAVYCAAILVESLALLSILEGAFGLAFGELFIPILKTWRDATEPFVGFGAALFSSSPPVWVVDAAAISGVLFFLFFIGQARKAIAPFEDGTYPPGAVVTRQDAFIDDALPTVLCALGAVLFAPTLLPLLTLPVALWLLGRKLVGRPAWFAVSNAYYVNCALLACVAAAGFWFG
ncbi:hypothetical protein KKP04_08005 [Rhodomicrobium sp. Az07]|uniref:hypothetical protein n=1 Tax=Rhodomicrobium sp. Az07 TaxID=2839034 RepID=UPI001BED0737|nr:hypothetical protein [Rhodomicrobium sp. Az07]MBT3070808.1 hypothetical protein [Rhodomicrobium sp. Az07]